MNLTKGFVILFIGLIVVAKVSSKLIPNTGKIIRGASAEITNTKDLEPIYKTLEKNNNQVNNDILFLITSRCSGLLKQIAIQKQNEDKDLYNQLINLALIYAKKTITLKATIDKINEDDAKNKSLIIINEYSQIYKSSDQGKDSVFANDLLICEKFGNQIQ